MFRVSRRWPLQPRILLYRDGGLLVVSDSTSPRRPVLSLDELAQPLTRRPERLYALSAGQLAVAFSRGLDLAEGKETGHAQRVCYIASRLAEGLDLDEEQRDGVFFAALLHDAGVGAVAGDLFRAAGIDETAIFAAAPLTHDEHRGPHFADRNAIDEAVRSHATSGGDVVRKLELGEIAARAVEHHHERWDGQGYPDGLAGEAIPLAARVFAVADAVDALTTDRPYRPASSFAHARQEVLRGSGTQFDPAVVAAYQQIPDSTFEALRDAL